MRKIFFIIIAAVLLLGVAGCESLRDAHNNAASLTPEAEVSPTRGGVLSVEQEANDALNKANASNIAIAINAYNALNPDNTLPDNATLAEVKKALEDSSLWPSHLDDAAAERAWELVEIKNGAAIVK